MSACVCVRYVCTQLKCEYILAKTELNFVWLPVVWDIKMRATTTTTMKKTTANDDDNQNCGAECGVCKTKTQHLRHI